MMTINSNEGSININGVLYPVNTFRVGFDEEKNHLIIKSGNNQIFAATPATIDGTIVTAENWEELCGVFFLVSTPANVNKRVLIYNEATAQYEYISYETLNNDTQAIVEESAIDKKILEKATGFLSPHSLLLNEDTEEWEIVAYSPDEWSPNYILNYGENPPTPADSITHIAIIPETDGDTDATDFVNILIWDGSAWNVATAHVAIKNGDLFSEYPSTEGYYWFGGKFNRLDFEVDLSSYYTKNETDLLFANKVDKVAGKGLSTNDFTNDWLALLQFITATQTIASLQNIAATCQNIYCELTANEALSVSSISMSNQPVIITVYCAAQRTIAIPNTSNYVANGYTSISVSAGKYTEINIIKNSFTGKYHINTSIQV
ncbi:MAG: hypothetical protein LBN27_05065 [Prevotellaceae bacterium]|jgi:hypothetical protein|nr:hypothetical protein [Prevotellaceae bacterium]